MKRQGPTIGKEGDKEGIFREVENWVKNPNLVVPFGSVALKLGNILNEKKGGLRCEASGETSV